MRQQDQNCIGEYLNPFRQKYLIQDGCHKHELGLQRFFSSFSLPRLLLLELRQCQQEVSGGFLSRLEWPCLAWLIKKRLGGLD